MSLADGNITITLSELTPSWLKANYLTGLEFVDRDGVDYPDSFFETHMQNAVRKLEELCDLCVLEKTIRGESHDYRSSDFLAWGFLQLFKVPIRRVTAMRAVYPVGTSIATYPNDWIQLTENGQVQLVPQRGSLGSAVIGQGGDLLPVLFSGVGHLPHLWEADYVAGFDPENMPRTIVEAIAKLACIDILTIMSNLARPLGLNSESLSIDGLSQSQSYQAPAFKTQLDQYTADLYGPMGKQPLHTTSGLLKQIVDYYRPLNMASLY
jgi:hypothetical protein